MGKNRAISIGINKYEFLQPLKYAQRDAELMQEFLVKEAGFEQVFFFSDDSPDYKGLQTRPSFVNLKRVLRTMFEKPFMQAGDNFWFFFSGHGMPHNGCDYLMACDSDAGDVKDTAISINYVTERLRRCGADNVVLILDACRGGQGSKSGEGIGNQSAEVAREKGVITFFSCHPNELSYELDALQHGAFTKALLEGLGIQGQCGTVERLNDYLSWRVPQLVRQHKSEKVRQTPYTIAEPVTKSHLIILPQYATGADIAALKIDASQAEAEKNFELAEQLWIRVLAAASGKDMYAIEAIKRIDRLQREYQASSQDNSVNNSVAKQAESPLSPKSQLVTNTAPIEPDAPLKSEPGVDYTKLRDLLATGEWQKADKETAKKMLEAAGRTKDGWLLSQDIDQFPCEDLRTIDQLWVKYSNGRFGFSVQKRIYESLGGSGEYNRKIWEAFGDRVGWRVNNRWLYYDEIKFSTLAPGGHLPVGRQTGGRLEFVSSGWAEFLSRVETCKV